MRKVGEQAHTIVDDFKAIPISPIQVYNLPAIFKDSFFVSDKRCPVKFMKRKYSEIKDSISEHQLKQYFLLNSSQKMDNIIFCNPFKDDCCPQP